MADTIRIAAKLRINSPVDRVREQSLACVKLAETERVKRLGERGRSAR